MEPQDDPLPAIIAALDQAVMMAPQMARLAREMFDAFVAQGFSESQALYLAACQLHGEPGSPA